MKAVGISGSPRKGGNTECLLDECMKEFAEHGWLAGIHFLYIGENDKALFWL